MKTIDVNGAIITEDIAKHIQDLEKVPLSRGMKCFAAPLHASHVRNMNHQTFGSD